MDKQKLDEILEKHKAEPVGYGYIDIIVPRDYYKNLISELAGNGFSITYITWWQWCPGRTETTHGLGGPASKYLEGWYSELIIGDDEINLQVNERRMSLKR